MSKPLGMTRRQALTTGIVGAVAATTNTFAAENDRQAPAISKRKRVLRLAHLTDTHVFDQRNAPQGFAKCLQHVQAQQDKPELIVFGGDNVMNVDGDGRATAKSQLAVWNRVVRAECSLPTRTVIGNHDVLAMHPVDGKKWAVDSFGLERRYSTFDQAGWRFILLDSTSPESGGYKGRLDAEQFAWLEDLIHNTPRTTPICIISHIPILAPCCYFDGNNEKTGNWVVPGAWMHLDARRLKDIFHKAGNVKLCLSGHIHLADTMTYLGTTYACNGAVSGGWWNGDNQEFGPAYGLVDLYDDGASEIQLIKYGWG